MHHLIFSKFVEFQAALKYFQPKVTDIMVSQGAVDNQNNFQAFPFTLEKFEYNIKLILYLIPRQSQAVLSNKEAETIDGVVFYLTLKVCLDCSKKGTVSNPESWIPSHSPGQISWPHQSPGHPLPPRVLHALIHATTQTLSQNKIRRVFLCPRKVYIKERCSCSQMTKVFAI